MSDLTKKIEGAIEAAVEGLGRRKIATKIAATEATINRMRALIDFRTVCRSADLRGLERNTYAGIPICIGCHLRDNQIMIGWHDGTTTVFDLDDDQDLASLDLQG